MPRRKGDALAELLRRLTPGEVAGALAGFAFLALAPGMSAASQIARGDVYRFVLRATMGFYDLGDWLVPHMGLWRDFSKPPLFHWLGALSMHVFGSTFFAFRLPTVLCAVAGVLMTYACARLLKLSLERALLGAALWTVCSAMFIYGRQPLLESPLAAAMLLAYYGLIRACLEKDARWLYAFGLGAGLSAMVKWVVGPLSLGVFAVVYVAGGGHAKWLRRELAHAAGAVALACAVAFAWPLWVLASEHRDFFLGQLRVELIGDRFKVPTSLGDFLVKGLLLGTIPWTLLLLPALPDLKRLERERRWALGAWVFSVMLPIVLISSRTSRYAFPALPAVAIAVAALCDPARGPWKGALRATALLFGPALAGAVAVSAKLGLLTPFLAVVGFLLSGFVLRKLWDGSALAGFGALALGFSLVFGVAVSRAGFNEIPPRVIAAIGERQVGRFYDSPDSAGTGFLPLVLGRTVHGWGKDDFAVIKQEGHLLVASGRMYKQLVGEAREAGYEVRAIEGWRSPYTNPTPAMLEAAWREGSTRAFDVDHYLVELH